MLHNLKSKPFLNFDDKMPEIKNIYIETYGCSANQNNSEIIAGLLQQAGINIVKNMKIADVAILNTCIVKSPTEQRMQSRIKEMGKRFSKFIVTGCMPDVDALLIRGLAPLASIVGSHNIHKICLAVRKISEGKRVEFLGKENEIKLCMPRSRKNSVIGITQILEGCIGECAYCITRFAKGKLFSYPKEKILQNIMQDLQSGCKEIWLTSQDNAAYGLDKGSYILPELLSEILELKGKFMLRLGMINPNHVLKILDKLIECYKNEKMFKFLHLPLQAGSNKVLKDMKRQYKVGDFQKIVKKFRAVFPTLTLSTDIIAGYPTETDEDFRESVEIIKETKPSILNISKFWPHIGTEANKLKEINAETIKARAIELMNLHKEIAFHGHEGMLGMQTECLVDKKGFENTWLARNSDYKLIVVNGSNLLGKFLKVRITKAKPHYLFGEILKNKQDENI